MKWLDPNEGMVELMVLELQAARQMHWRNSSKRRLQCIKIRKIADKASKCGVKNSQLQSNMLLSSKPSLEQSEQLWRGFAQQLQRVCCPLSIHV